MNEKEPSPEQLLKMLEIQMQNSRAQREKRSENRTTFRVFAIAIFLVLLVGALWIAMMLAEELTGAKGSRRTDNIEALPAQK